jgi:alpha-mannosidase
MLMQLIVQKLEDWKSSHLTKATAIDPNYSLPLNVALITLQVTLFTPCLNKINSV